MARSTVPTALDPLLEAGLVLVVVASPLPFASVPPPSRLALEAVALALLLLWGARAALAPVVLPPRPLLGGLLGLLLLGAAQLVPVPRPFLNALSPAAAALRDSFPADPGAAVAGTLSIDPLATASALRTGSALVALVLVATTVAATRGTGRIALALLLSAAAQGLYGFLVLASGHDRIWGVAKRFYLDSATGTFVNRNHFASYLAMGLAVGLALTLREYRRSRDGAAGRASFAAWLGGRGSRTLLLGLALALAALGVAFSSSRAGIATSLLGLAVVAVAGGTRRRVAPRIAAVALVVAAVAVPLAQVGHDRLTERFVRVQDDLVREGSRSTVWSDSVRVAADFPIAGAGFGAFASIYPLYRSPEVRAFFAHTHSDPLQLAVEGGALGLLALTVALLSLAGVIVRALGGSAGVLGVGLAAALIAVLLHALVDFPFHIPANAATAAILAGLLVGLPCAART